VHQFPGILQGIADRFTVYIFQELALICIGDKVFFLFVI
jgi:hypothetical protein